MLIFAALYLGPGGLIAWLIVGLIAGFLAGKVIDDVTVFKLTKQALDESNLKGLGEHLFRLVDEQGQPQLHLDFGDVRYISSLGLGKVISLHKKVQNLGGSLTLVNVDENVYEIFEATRLTAFIDIRRKEDSE